MAEEKPGDSLRAVILVFLLELPQFKGLNIRAGAFALDFFLAENSASIVQDSWRVSWKSLN